MSNYKCKNNCCILKIKKYIPKNTVDKTLQKRKKAGAFIYDPNADKVLLVQSKGNFWGPPKGSISINESETDCAIREVYEETGIIISQKQFLSAIKIQDRAIYYYIEMKECDIEVQNSIEDNDANGITWIKPDCLEKLIKNGNILLSQHCRIVFSYFLKKYFSNSVFIKV